MSTREGAPPSPPTGARRLLAAWAEILIEAGRPMKSPTPNATDESENSTDSY
jgi:hypothetical protein